MHSNTCFGAYLYSVGTHHENLLKLILFRCVLLAALVLANAVSPWRNCGHTEKQRFPKPTQLKSRDDFGQNESEWTGAVEIKTILLTRF